MYWAHCYLKQEKLIVPLTNKSWAKINDKLLCKAHQCDLSTHMKHVRELFHFKALKNKLKPFKPTWWERRSVSSLATKLLYVFCRHSTWFFLYCYLYTPFKGRYLVLATVIKRSPSFFLFSLLNYLLPLVFFVLGIA